MQRLPVGEQVPLNQEANRRFWERTGYKVGLPLGDSPEDREQAKLWFEIRDEMLAERDKLAALPPEIKSVLGGDGAIPAKDYEKALEVAGKLAKLDPKDRAMYQLNGLTDGLDELDRKLDRAAGKPGEATASPAEMSRLLQVFRIASRIHSSRIATASHGSSSPSFSIRTRTRSRASSRAVRPDISPRPRSIRSSASTASSSRPNRPATRSPPSSRPRTTSTRSSSTILGGRSCRRKSVGCSSTTPS